MCLGSAWRETEIIEGVIICACEVWARASARTRVSVCFDRIYIYVYLLREGSTDYWVMSCLIIETPTVIVRL